MVAGDVPLSYWKVDYASNFMGWANLDGVAIWDIPPSQEQIV